MNMPAELQTLLILAAIAAAALYLFRRRNVGGCGQCSSCGAEKREGTETAQLVQITPPPD